LFGDEFWLQNCLLESSSLQKKSKCGLLRRAADAAALPPRLRDVELLALLNEG
jgi:hypothetical protein